MSCDHETCVCYLSKFTADVTIVKMATLNNCTFHCSRLLRPKLTISHCHIFTKFTLKTSNLVDNWFKLLQLPLHISLQNRIICRRTLVRLTPHITSRVDIMPMTVFTNSRKPETTNHKQTAQTWNSANLPQRPSPCVLVQYHVLLCNVYWYHSIH